MKPFVDWSAYKDAGMGDAYADIPKHGGDFAKAALPGDGRARHLAQVLRDVLLRDALGTAKVEP